MPLLLPHVELDVVIVGVRLELILIVQDAVPEHPFASVPVTVYVVLAVGLAVGFEIVVELNPPGGLHKNVVPPLAVSETPAPAQTDEFAGVMLIVGVGFTTT